MKKDVIYIDTEDDITAIIGKIKDSHEKIVALVPPKRIGVLQSAVNLKLLARIAEGAQKRLVLVTNNKALINLSAVAKIPIARSLQSKPEIADMDELDVDESEDVIEGDKLPIGDLMKTADEPMDIDIKVDNVKSENVSDIIDEIDVESESGSLPAEDKKDDIIVVSKPKIKVPNFIKFRRILFLVIIGIIGLSGFLVWAIKYAPAADVVIVAKTEDESVSMTVKLGAETNIETGVIKTTTQELTRDLSVAFEATGQKNTGNLAVGIITIENCDDNRSFTISAGTIFTAGSGESFSSNSDALVPGFSGSASQCRANGTGAGTVDIAVTATQPGEEYNISDTSYDISGVNGDIYAHGGDMSGGTTVMSSVVTQADIDKATDALKALSTDSAKQSLISQFTDGETVIAESYSITYGDFVSTPAVDQEVTDKAILKSSTLFKMSAIAKSDLEAYLDNAFSKKISSSSKKIYDNGIDSAKLSGYLSNADGITVKITASGKIGPNLDEALLKDIIKGKKFGDAQSTILSIPGVSDVEITFSYFWIQTVPGDTEKINVQFILEDSQNA